MTTWTLILMMAAASNASTAIVVPNLTSYQECVRVERVIKEGPIGHEYRWTTNNVSQCVEVHTK